MIKILSEPIGDNYKLLIDYVASFCSVFSLVWPYDMPLEESTNEVHEWLKEFQVSKTVIENEWVTSANAVLPVFRKFMVTPDSIKILKEIPTMFACPERENKVSWRIKKDRTPGLYSWVSPCLPEDPIFYSNGGQIGFHSVSHEEEAFFLDDTISVNKILKKIPLIKLKKMNKFEPDNLPAFICSHVYNNAKPVLLVCHEDGDWQFLCGENHHIEEKPKIVCISHLTKIDPTLNEIADLPNGWEAERTAIGEKWIQSKYGKETDD